MPVNRQKERKRQSLSVPGRHGNLTRHLSISDTSSLHDLDSAPRKSRDSRRRNSNEQVEHKQKTRTISVPVGLKEILNELSKEVIFAQPKNIPLYCAQLLENRLNERLRNEENQLKEELLKQKLKDDYKRQIDQAREEFRKKSKSSNQKRHCESQTGFTTDSDSGFERETERGKRLPKTASSHDICTAEDSMDSQFTDNDCVVSPKLVDKEPINKKVQDEKQSKDTKSELPKDNVVNKIVDKYKKVELQADSKTNVTQNETKSDNKDVQNAPIMKDKKQTSKTKRLVSVSEPLDKAMEQLSLALEDGDVSFGMNSPDSPASAPSRQETEPEVSTPGRPGAQLHSLLLPTSDFEEECRSESDEDRDKQDQIVTLNIDVDGGKSHCIHLLISRKGVTKVTSEAVDDHLVNVTRTTVPIVFCPPTKFQEKKAEIENINNCISSNGADLVVTGVGVRAGPSQDVGQTSNNKQVKRSLSPVLCPVASPRKPGSELIRQRTFVETYSQTSVNSLGVGPDIPDSQDCHSLTDRQIKVTTNVKVVESVTQTQQEKCEEKDTQTEVIKDVTVFGTQTIPVAMSQASIQTEPSHVVEEVITQNIPSLTRTPRYEITFAGTQTSPRITAITGMTSHTQTSPQVTSRTRESSPSSCRTSSRPAAGAGMMTEDAADEMVCRVLLEHAGVSDSDQDDTKSAISDSSTIPDDTDRSASFLSGESGRATSYDNKLQKVKDLSRTVNYLDLSRLGNEGETPNSDEIWVTVEDDNKFLTSDTETYSVATDKVSTMATFKGHAVGSGFAENIALLNSASETELAELGNESLASDLEGQDFSLQNFGNLLHHQMEPIRTRLDSTGRTVSGIAETLYHIQDGINNLCCNVTQMKSKVLSNGFEEAEQENTMFVADETVKGDEKLELIKDGVPVGEPEHLVEKMMVKLDSALRRRDENIKNVMLSLEEDNKQLRQELELYRQREIGASEQSTQLESKIQMVLDSMEKLSQKSVPSKSPRSDNSSKDPTPPIAETKPKFKRRSKSRPKDSLEQSSSEGNPKEIPKLKPKRQSAFANDSTSSDSDTQQQKPNKSKSAIKVDKLQVMVTNTQTENVALKQDLVEQKEKEAQLVKRNLELEAQLVKALTPSDDKSRSPVVTPSSSEAQKKVDQETREVQTSATGVRNCSSAAVNTDATPGPVLYVESPSSSSPSKSDSPVKDDNILKTKTQTRKSRARVKVTKGASSGEVTEVGEVHGRGNGVDGGTPSPSPSRDKEGERDKEKKLVTPPKTEAKTNGNGNKNNANGNSKSRSLSKSNGNGNGKKAPVKANDNKTVKKEANGGKKTTFEEPKKKAEDSKKAKGVTNGNKAAVNLGTKNASDTKSKVIEGDDFRVTITSNADLVSCEFSDVEDPGSPRKKIIVTPKTPDSKKQEQKKQEVVKKGGKIPIRETYIKQKAELPAPQQYPAARPSRDQLPHPVPKNYSGSCGASPNFTSPLALSLNQPMTVNYVGYNTCQPATPINDHTIMCSPSDRSLASTNIPFSGRNTVMSYDGSDVFTMMIKQESRDSNVYDAPSYIPDIYTRESPDGAYSYVIDGPAISSMSNISDLKHDVEINEEESSDGFEKDIIRDFVMLEENKKYSLDRRKGATPFKGYAEKVKQKVIREYVNPIRNNKVDFSEKDRPPTRVLPVRKQQAKRLLKSRSQSLSVDQLNELSDGGSKKHPVRMTKSRNTYYSTERLPTLTASEEERIIRLKKYEDDTEKLNEKRAAALRVKEAKEKYKSRKQKSFHYDNEVTIYETNRPWTVPDELTIEDNAADCGLEDNNDTEINANYHESAANKIEGLTNGVEASEDDQNNNKQTEEGNGSLSQKRRKLKKWRGLSPMAKVNNKVVGFNQLPLSVECFIVGRGWQVDQAQLNKAIARLDGINFVRIQIANTINRVVENIRPHNDVVLIHIGTNELSEACHSINTEENVPGLAGSMASVFSRHIITACRTFRETKLVVSVPIPRNTTDNKNNDTNDSLQFYDPLRKAFTNCLRANFIDYDNVIICSNDNLANESGQPDSKFYTDSVNLNNAGMKKLTKNWEAIIQRMKRISEGVIHYRRSSESSSIASSSAGSSTGSSSSSSLVHRNPWKPY